MDMGAEETCTICTHCDRPIPSANIDLHFVHCSRNLEKCKVCGEMVPKKHAEEHYLDTHAPVACSLCTVTMERDILDVHKGESCPQRIITCDFCEFPLPAIDLIEHQEVCGNRTEHCHRCSRYIRLRDTYVHETTCNGVVEGIVGSSRDGSVAAERPPRPERRAAPPFLRRHLLFSIAITGIAFIIGSLIFQKKPDSTLGSNMCNQTTICVGQRTNSRAVLIFANWVVIDNGILQMTISNPDGMVTKIVYNGIENLLEETNEEDNRGYWDLNWSEAGAAGTTGIYERNAGTTFNVIVEDEEMVEVSFSRTWDTSYKGKLVPLKIDKRFIVLQGSSGFYSYAIYEKLQEWPGFNLAQTRIVFKLNKEWFQYMAVADNRQRNMPLPDDRLPERCQALAYPEAVLLTNPVEPEFKGEVDDKYQYSCENRDLKVQGWICKDPPTGFWQITPSDEFRTGGPLKQNLTSHVGPINLAMFMSAHYVGEDMVVKFADGEPWKRVFGPVFMYLNGLPKGFDWNWLWEDAKEQWFTETESWPYSFPASEDFPTSDQRGNISGRLVVCDRYSDDDYTPADGAYVGLASPNEAKTWQLESKGYQFWTKADEDGYFYINDIRAGDYNLYAWVPGFIGAFVSDTPISIAAGCEIDMGDLVYKPPRDGPTMWEIGIPDRTAKEFYVPDPDPMYVNKLYINHPDRFRQYGLWDRYAELYPDEDLVYTIGASEYQKDWFFAQVTRKKDNTYLGTTWQIRFKLDNVNQSGVYKLRLALAMANQAELQVRVNDEKADPPLFTTGLIGHDNAIARHGIHGIYRLYTADIQGTKLLQGDNTVFLTQSKGGSPFVGIMYDYIRLEAPPDSDSDSI